MPCRLAGPLIQRTANISLACLSTQWEPATTQTSREITFRVPEENQVRGPSWPLGSFVQRVRPLCSPLPLTHSLSPVVMLKTRSRLQIPKRTASSLEKS